ncbi:MAG: hypothetical protein R2789_11590 [Microthrixaceae bacterium]
MNAVTDQLVPFVAPTIDQDEAPVHPSPNRPWATSGSHRRQPRRGMRLTCHEVELSLVDRAVINGDTEGFVRLYTRRGSSRIVVQPW